MAEKSFDVKLGGCDFDLQAAQERPSGSPWQQFHYQFRFDRNSLESERQCGFAAARLRDDIESRVHHLVLKYYIEEAISSLLSRQRREM